MRYIVYQDVSKLWRWRLVAKNNETIASGESYYNKSDCHSAISLVKGSGDAPVYEQ